MTAEGTETRAVALARKMEELGTVNEGLQHMMMAQMEEARLLRQALIARGIIPDPHVPGELPRPPPPVQVAQLRPPNIAKFYGDESKAADFITAMDRRLSATGQIATEQGLDFAVGHLEGTAAIWWRSFSATHPACRTWAALRPEFEMAFEMVAEQETFEKALMELTQTGTVKEYIDEFLSFSIRLKDLSDGFLQRQFARGANSFLREKFAERKFASLLEMVRWTKQLLPLVPAERLLPDAPKEAPVIAAMAVKGQRKTFRGACYGCGRLGHRHAECRTNPLSAQPQTVQRTGPKPQHGKPVKGTFQPGKYNGTGRVHAVEAEPVHEEESDDDVRQGKDLA